MQNIPVNYPIYMSCFGSLYCICNRQKSIVIHLHERWGSFQLPVIEDNILLNVNDIHFDGEEIFVITKSYFDNMFNLVIEKYEQNIKNVIEFNNQFQHQ